MNDHKTKRYDKNTINSVLFSFCFLFGPRLTTMMMMMLRCRYFWIHLFSALLVHHGGGGQWRRRRCTTKKTRTLCILWNFCVKKKQNCCVPMFSREESIHDWKHLCQVGIDHLYFRVKRFYSMKLEEEDDDNDKKMYTKNDVVVGWWSSSWFTIFGRW